MNGTHYLVTGGTSGIGYEVVKQLHCKGVNLTLLVRNEAKAHHVFPRKSFPNINILVCDLNDRTTVESLSSYFLQNDVQYDGLIYSAGLGFFKSLESHTSDEILTTYQLNTIHFSILLNILKPYLIENPKIVVLSSMSGLATQPYAAHYAASKAALIQILNALRIEEPSYHVLNVILGPVKTPFHDHADPLGTFKRKTAVFMLKPERVSKIIIVAMEKGRQELRAPKWMSIMLRFYSLAPRTIEKIAKPFFMSKMQ
ncbi:MULTISPECIES: SDR family NAD(P)-dependent oxidoreductase [unclassified Staphylococcus]|uniref:SDR family NAD(P)-dependent oxidoreductase n=1 Tax=unclassified Staphylococcus TaxID=91994 RepID=UPI0021CFBC35|nr:MULTISPECIES: SDR family NAD(P)-dependent oxidoreductase [unclassified Staphylococcus]UXR79279.1 SDR family NAD(P)-dependent oxidoreductase [Staphylococcus sp. IVB6227]UXR81530.1 SDR family NAD(P)-dependent oxidoreductase [Staphylococcus sp. IVB6214]